MEMNSLEKYNAVFKNAFGVNEGDFGKELTYQSIPAWDSVGHMQLIAALEEAFDIMLEMDDIIDLSSFEKGKEILKKYNVEL